MPVMFDVAPLLDGRRSAVLVPATLDDLARLTPDGDWLPLGGTPLGEPIYDVDHFGHSTHHCGENMVIRSLTSGQLYQFITSDIRLVRCDDLTADVLAALGHDTRASFDAEWGEALGSRRAWLIYLAPLP